ncbi:PREDICTED: origin of replication complex subunit 6-like [Brassica oleracea var. oleracea]|uniref:origin of replication complex subunit 6-like n=1 Tax=Brassica oleracea var. oleracea TaxID=109376 RepID=UPI0006A6C488|nr:PREDICTED: origin of replication complex subunit 6-like [Brassica oleracea var. oleracea]
MDISDILVVRKAAEIRRLCDAQFDSSVIGVGEICKAVICLEMAASRLQVIFDRQAAIKLSGMSEKAYTRSFNSLQNVIGVKIKLNVKELAIQFGCVRIIKSVHNMLSLYKERFLASLPASRRANADFTRPVFTAAAFYLCAKKQKLKVDKLRLVEVCGTSESEFSCVSTSMTDLCFDCVGVSKEKKDAKDVKGNRELLDVLPEKRKLEDGGYSSDDESSCYKRHKKMEEAKYEDWKSTVVNSIKKNPEKGPKKVIQTSLNFTKKAETQELQVDS